MDKRLQPTVLSKLAQSSEFRSSLALRQSKNHTPHRGGPHLTPVSPPNSTFLSPNDARLSSLVNPDRQLSTRSSQSSPSNTDLPSLSPHNTQQPAITVESESEPSTLTTQTIYPPPPAIFIEDEGNLNNPPLHTISKEEGRNSPSHTRAITIEAEINTPSPPNVTGPTVTIGSPRSHTHHNAPDLLPTTVGSPSTENGCIHPQPSKSNIHALPEQLQSLPDVTVKHSEQISPLHPPGTIPSSLPFTTIPPIRSPTTLPQIHPSSTTPQPPSPSTLPPSPPLSTTPPLTSSDILPQSTQDSLVEEGGRGEEEEEEEEEEMEEAWPTKCLWEVEKSDVRVEPGSGCHGYSWLYQKDQQ